MLENDKCYSQKTKQNTKKTTKQHHHHHEPWGGVSCEYKGIIQSQSPCDAALEQRPGEASNHWRCEQVSRVEGLARVKAGGYKVAQIDALNIGKDTCILFISNFTHFKIYNAPTYFHFHNFSKSIL